VHGSRDPFGALEEMRTALQLIPAQTALVEIEGAGHDLKGAKFPARALDTILRRDSSGPSLGVLPGRRNRLPHLVDFEPRQ
jgi:hypothetical protein